METGQINEAYVKAIDFEAVRRDLSTFPNARKTTLHGKGVTIRYGNDFSSGEFSVARHAPAPSDEPLPFESVRLLFEDGNVQGAELPRFWREWDDVTLETQLPHCRIFGAR